MEPSSGSLFTIDNKLASTQNTSSKRGESKTSTNNDRGEFEYFDVTGSNTSSYWAASQKVWGIDLIWEHITDYLSVSDLKELSIVNKYFLEKVRNISRFRSTAGQIVAGQLKIHTFNLCRAVVKVNTLDDKILQESAADIFQNTEYLELRNMDEPVETGNSRLIQIVANCPKLKSLAFQKWNNLRWNWEPFFTNENVKSVFSNLEELHVEIDTENVYYQHHQDDHYTGWGVCKALHRISKYFPDLQMKLTKFSYTYSDPHNDEYYFYPELLLRSSEETLEELKITVDCQDFKAMETMQFPKLKKLHLQLNERYPVDQPKQLIPYVGHTLVPFLRKHLLTLCEFVLESNNAYSLSPFCELFKSSKKIQVLQFSTRPSFGKSLRSTNWDFLNSQLNFRDFKLCMEDAENDGETLYYCYDDEEELVYENGEEHVIYIPQKNNSHYISQYLDAFPSTIESIEFGHSITNRLVPIPTVILTTSLARLENLTSLKVNCRPFLNDDIVQFISQHLTKLRILEGDFTEVTDFGITGVRGNGEPDSGISLTNLKGLRKLTMCAPFNDRLCITWSGLHKAICFLELIELNIVKFDKYIDPVTNFPFELNFEDKEKIKLNFLILINGNPSLEHIHIDVPGLPDTFNCKKFPRVKTLSRHSPSPWYAEMLNGPTITSEADSAN